jgi:hypothetical protein
VSKRPIVLSKETCYSRHKGYMLEYGESPEHIQNGHIDMTITTKKKKQGYMRNYGEDPAKPETYMKAAEHIQTGSIEMTITIFAGKRALLLQKGSKETLYIGKRDLLDLYGHRDDNHHFRR